MSTPAPQPGMPAIEVENLVTYYGQQKILDDISLSVQPGEIMVIMGGSGSGKSTLLRYLLGLHRPDSGVVRLFGRDISRISGRQWDKLRRKIGVSFQGGALFNSMTVGENVRMPLREHAALDEDAATIRLAGQDYQVPVAEISALWYGEYLLLWRPQIGAVKSFYPGMRDPDVAWLRESLATIQGNPIDPISAKDVDLFDEALEASVRDYQIARRLSVDGLVGQQTQILINSDLGVSAPRLVRQN